MLKTTPQNQSWSSHLMLCGKPWSTGWIVRSPLLLPRSYFGCQEGRSTDNEIHASNPQTFGDICAGGTRPNPSRLRKKNRPELNLERMSLDCSVPENNKGSFGSWHSRRSYCHIKLKTQTGERERKVSNNSAATAAAVGAVKQSQYVTWRQQQQLLTEIQASKAKQRRRRRANSSNNNNTKDTTTNAPRFKSINNLTTTATTTTTNHDIGN